MLREHECISLDSSDDEDQMNEKEEEIDLVDDDGSDKSDAEVEKYIDYDSDENEILVEKGNIFADIKQNIKYL